jgi:hypothetical protein
MGSSVILALNGFGGNEKMVRTYLGDVVAENAFYFGSMYVTNLIDTQVFLNS